MAHVAPLSIPSLRLYLALYTLDLANDLGSSLLLSYFVVIEAIFRFLIFSTFG